INVLSPLGQTGPKPLTNSLPVPLLFYCSSALPFLASDYCYGVEMHQAIQRHEAGRARVIPIIVPSVDWSSSPFSHLSALPATGKPLAEQHSRDAAFANVAADLRRVIEELAPAPTNRSLMDTASGVWNVPYRRNPHFTGRDELLGRIEQQL